MNDHRFQERTACQIRFAYSQRRPERLIWGEPCKSVTARMVSLDDLASMSKWARLDAAARKSVLAMPHGKVLYVEGAFSASIFPIGTSGKTYEVPVAD